ncbi:hypothetical protein CDL15_Pgr009561 [Punica granatum]|uniref:Protein UXT homolog n=1 Tax=Punica granatum TaxID=22663 RepID=A0A218WSR6_PUNGR|nr:hypothetical protein CDL15_Pgr009561 [Punica granatum]
MDGYVPEEVRKCEEFMDRKMKPSLVRATNERNKLFEQQKILYPFFFSDLRKNIENLQKNSITNLRTMVNIGSEVYMQAEVPDTQRIFVDIGYGFHVEFTWDEALNYIPLREELLARQIEECTRRIVRIKADIKRFKEVIDRGKPGPSGRQQRRLHTTLHVGKATRLIASVSAGTREHKQLDWLLRFYPGS